MEPTVKVLEFLRRYPRTLPSVIKFDIISDVKHKEHFALKFVTFIKANTLHQHLECQIRIKCSHIFGTVKLIFLEEQFHIARDSVNLQLLFYCVQVLPFANHDIH